MQLRSSFRRAAGRALALALGLALASPAGAQTFVRVTDTSNPVTTSFFGAYAGVSWVDVDGDGDDDLFVSGANAGLFRNDGSGTFVKIPNALPSQGTGTANSWADVDNDGDLDAFVASGLNQPPGVPGKGSSLYLNQGGNVFTKVTTGVIGDTLANAAWGCAFGDYDNDGRIDLVTAAANGFAGINVPNRLFHNLGGVVFARVDTAAMCQTLAPYTNAAWSDYDGDGDVDCFIAAGPTNTSARDYLYTNRNEVANSWFERIDSTPLGTDLQDGQMYHWIDYDNDGDLDTYLTNYNGGGANKLYRNEGGGVFTRITTAGLIVIENFRSLGAIWQDFDNDGDLDCVVTNDGPDPGRYYVNNNDGTFATVAVTDLNSSGPRWGGSSADYDGDGDMDLCLSAVSGKAGLLVNTSPATNGWLDVKLQATVSNRAAIGARVRVRAMVGGAPRWQMREISAQNTFGGMNSLVAHFGLGDAAVVDSLIVEWPSGVETVQTAIAPRQRVTVIEDASTPALLALARAETVDGGIALHWILDGSWDAIAVERRTEAESWSRWAAIERGPEGDLRAFDRSATAGLRYGYRLRVTEGLTEQILGEIWADAPPAAPAAARIRSIRPNPSPGLLQVELALAAGLPATLELFDIGGRRVARTTIESPQAGVHTHRFGEGGALPAGVYVVRLTQGGHQHSSRAVVRE